MLNPHIDGNLLMSRIQSDAGTAAGMNLARKMVQGFVPCFSCRAIANLTLKNNKPVVNVKKIITYDWVLFQSHREAEQDKSKPTNFINKTPVYATESANGSNDVLIPLKEILESVGETDVNARMIMESFELTNDDIVGFSKQKDHLIMRDDNNMIYCNMDKKSRRKLNEFLHSF